MDTTFISATFTAIVVGLAYKLIVDGIGGRIANVIAGSPTRPRRKKSRFTFWKLIGLILILTFVFYLVFKFWALIAAFL